MHHRPQLTPRRGATGGLALWQRRLVGDAMGGDDRGGREGSQVLRGRTDRVTAGGMTEMTGLMCHARAMVGQSSGLAMCFRWMRTRRGGRGRQGIFPS
jgi:hypothetical protein